MQTAQFSIILVMLNIITMMKIQIKKICFFYARMQHLESILMVIFIGKVELF